MSSALAKTKNAVPENPKTVSPVEPAEGPSPLQHSAFVVEIEEESAPLTIPGLSECLPAGYDMDFLSLDLGGEIYESSSRTKEKPKVTPTLPKKDIVRFILGIKNLFPNHLFGLVLRLADAGENNRWVNKEILYVDIDNDNLSILTNTLMRIEKIIEPLGLTIIKSEAAYRIDFINETQTAPKVTQQKVQIPPETKDPTVIFDLIAAIESVVTSMPHPTIRDIVELEEDLGKKEYKNPSTERIRMICHLRLKTFITEFMVRMCQQEDRSVLLTQPDIQDLLRKLRRC